VEVVNCAVVGVEETGHTVVERMMVSVVKWPFPGQLVTVGAQDVLV
jgi:hypothetical protein